MISRILGRSLLAATLVLAGGSVSLAAEVVDIILEDGRVHRAELLEVREDGILVKGRTKSGGKAELVILADRLDPIFYYGLRDQAAGEDARARLKLALWAIEKGLFSRAQIQVRRAAEIDPQLVSDIREGKLPEIREGIAARVLESARRDLKEGKLGLAQEKTELLLARMPDTPAGAEAVDFLTEVEGVCEAAAIKAHDEALAKLEAEELKREKERERLLEPVRATLKKARAIASAGLKEDDGSKAIGALGQALEMGVAALKKLDAVDKKALEDPVLQGQADALRTEITGAMVKGYVHQAEMYLWRGSLPQAKEEAAKARALAPDDSSIDAIEYRIEEYERDNDKGIRWQRHGPGASRFGGRRGGGGGGGLRR